MTASITMNTSAQCLFVRPRGAESGQTLVPGKEVKLGGVIYRLEAGQLTLTSESKGALAAICAHFSYDNAVFKENEMSPGIALKPMSKDSKKLADDALYHYILKPLANSKWYRADNQDKKIYEILKLSENSFEGDEGLQVWLKCRIEDLKKKTDEEVAALRLKHDSEVDNNKREVMRKILRGIDVRSEQLYCEIDIEEMDDNDTYPNAMNPFSSQYAGAEPTENNEHNQPNLTITLL